VAHVLLRQGTCLLTSQILVLAFLFLQCLLTALLTSQFLVLAFLFLQGLLTVLRTSHYSVLVLFSHDK
jgi:hypothetical protein